MDNLNYKNNSPDQGFAWKNTSTDSIPGSILLIEKKGPGLLAGYPVKLENVVAIICLKGKMSGTLNLNKYTVTSPGLFIVTSGQILHNEHFSRDFHGKGIVLSKGFWKDFQFDNRLSFPLFLSVKDNPWIPLIKEDLDSVNDFFDMLQKTISNKENQYRLEAARFLIIAFFYGFSYRYHKLPDDLDKKKQDIMVDKFMVLVKENYRQHREPAFYSDKLFITTKHLSKVLKQKSRKSAADWIEDYVMLEAKALLKSTGMTIGQISDELNFPSQSFFGKYFKRRSGLSPNEYRKNSQV